MGGGSSGSSNSGGGGGGGGGPIRRRVSDKCNLPISTGRCLVCHVVWCSDVLLFVLGGVCLRASACECVCFVCMRFQTFCFTNRSADYKLICSMGPKFYVH